MSGIYRRPLVVKAVLICDGRGCDERWESEPYDALGSTSEGEAVHDALMDGWAVYVGKRSQYTYCPQHGPSRSMRLIHGLPLWMNAIEATS